MIKYHTLSNGMRLVVVPSSARQRVRVQMLYDVGSAHEAAQEKGLAHLLEHMIFKGTGELPEGAVSALANKYGAQFNAFTANDMTSYYFEVDSNNWKPFIPLLADCMENVLLDEQHLASEVKAVIQELRMRNDRESTVLFEELFAQTFSEEHPYHVPIIGYKKDLGALTADRLKAFYKKYYVPERATLFVVGDVDVEVALAEVEKYFAHIVPSGRTFESPVQKEFVKNRGFHTTLSKHWVKPHSIIAWSMPTLVDETADVITMAAKVLGENASSILHKRIIDRDQSADEIGCFVYRLVHETMFIVYFQPREGRTQDCVDAIIQELEKIAKKPIDSIVLDRAIKAEKIKAEMMKGMLPSALLSYDTLVNFILTGSLNLAFNAKDRLSQVTAEKISQFVEQYLSKNLMSRIDMIPQTQEQKELWAREQLADQALEAEILALHVRTLPYPENVQAPISQKYPDAQPIAITIPHSTKIMALSNGIQVTVNEQSGSDICAFMFGNMNQYQMAGTLDGCYKSLIDNLIGEGSMGLSKQELLDWFADRGINLNVPSNSFICLSEDFSEVMTQYLKMYQQPNFLKQASFFGKLFGSQRELRSLFEKIKEQEIQKLKALYDDPAALAQSAESSARYPSHPYGISLEEMIGKMNALTFDELPVLYEKLTNAHNQVISVVGNVNADEIITIIKSATVDWKGVLQTKNEAVVTAKDVEDIHVPMARDQIYLSFIRESDLPAFQLSEERVGIDLLSIIYLGSLGSRIFKLRDATGIFYTAGGTFGGLLPTGFGKTQDKVVTIVSPEKLDEAIALFESFLKTVFSTPIMQEELDSAKSLMRNRIATSSQGNISLANYFMTLLITKKSEEYREKYLEILTAMTTQTLEKIAQKYGQQGAFVRVSAGNLIKK